MVSQNILIIGAIALIGLLLGGFFLFGGRGDNDSEIIDESDLLEAGKKFLNVSSKSDCLDVELISLKPIAVDGIAEFKMKITNDCDKLEPITASFNTNYSERKGLVELIANNEKKEAASYLKENEEIIIIDSLNKGNELTLTGFFQPFKESKGQKIEIDLEIKGTQEKGEEVHANFDWVVRAVNLGQCINIDKKEVEFEKTSKSGNVFVVDASECNAEDFTLSFCKDDDCNNEGIDLKPEKIALTGKKTSVQVQNAELGSHKLKLMVEVPDLEKTIEVGSVTVNSREFFLPETETENHLDMPKTNLALFSEETDSFPVNNYNATEVIDVTSDICTLTSSIKNDKWFDLPDQRGYYVKALIENLDEIKNAAEEARKIGKEKNTEIVEAYNDTVTALEKTEEAHKQAVISKTMEEAALEGTETAVGSHTKAVALTNAALDLTDTSLIAAQGLKATTDTLSHSCSNSSSIQNAAGEAKDKMDEAKDEMNDAKENSKKGKEKAQEAKDSMNDAVDSAKEALNDMKSALDFMNDAFDEITLAVEDAAIDAFYSASEDDANAAEHLRNTKELVENALDETESAIENSNDALEYAEEAKKHMNGTDEEDGALDYAEDAKKNIENAIKKNNEATAKNIEVIAMATAGQAACDATYAASLGTDVLALSNAGIAGALIGEAGALEGTLAASLAGQEAVLTQTETTITDDKTSIELIGVAITQEEKVTIPAEEDANESQETAITSLQEAIDAADYLTEDEKLSTEKAKFVENYNYSSNDPTEKLELMQGNYISAGYILGNYESGLYDIVGGCENKVNMKLIDFITNLKTGSDYFKSDLAGEIKTTDDSVLMSWFNDELEISGMWDIQHTGINARLSNEENENIKAAIPLTKHVHANPMTIEEGLIFGNFNLPDVNEEIITDEFYFSIKRRPETTSLAEKDYSNECRTGLLRGSAKKPKVTYDWDFVSFEDYCLDPEVYVNDTPKGFCDASQATAGLSYRMDQLDDFIVKNAGALICPENPSRNVLEEIKPETYDLGLERNCWLPRTTKDYIKKNTPVPSAIAHYGRAGGVPDEEIAGLGGIIESRVNLMKDSLSNEAVKAIIKEYKGNRINAKTPSWFDESEYVEKMDSGNKVIKYSNKNAVLPDAGTYQVRQNADFDDSWNLKNLDLEFYLHESSGVDSLLYYLPINGLTVNENREYGVAVAGFENPLRINERFEINSKTNKNSIINLVANTVNETKKANYDLKRKGKLLTLNFINPQNVSIELIESSPVPIQMKSDNAVQKEDADYVLASSKNNGIEDVVNTVGVWNDEIFKCAGITSEQENSIPDKASYDEEGKKYRISDDLTEVEGTYKSIFYVGNDGMAIRSTEENGTRFSNKGAKNEKVIEVSEKYAFEESKDTLNEIINGIEKENLCVSETQNSVNIYWNESKVYQETEGFCV